MDILLSGLAWTDCLVYLDDVVIFASTLKEHRERLDRVLTRFEEAGKKIKPEKCKLLPEKMPLLGHVVSTDGIEVDQEKVAVMLAWPRPTNVSELRSFLGHTGYYQRFIPGYANLTAPLRKLEKKGSIFMWDADCTLAFQKLKHLLTTAPVLAFPKYKLPFVLDVDASNDGWEPQSPKSRMGSRDQSHMPQRHFKVLNEHTPCIRKRC